MKTDPLDCGSAPAIPCVGGGGCDQPCPLQAPPCPVLKMPSRRAGGQCAGKEGSVKCPAVMQAMPDDSHHLGVPIPPAKRLRRAERRKETGRWREKSESNDQTDKMKSTYRLCNLHVLSQKDNSDYFMPTTIFIRKLTN